MHLFIETSFIPTQYYANKIFLFDFMLFYICERFACMYVCTTHASVHGSQKRVLDPLKWS